VPRRGQRPRLRSPVGWDAPRSICIPLRECILAHLKSSANLFADETTAPVLDPGRGRTKTGAALAYARDDRPWRGRRSAGGRLCLRARLQGVAADRASRRLHRRPPGRRLRRALAETLGIASRSAGPTCGGASISASPIANEAFQHIALLYTVENEIRGAAADTRRAVRQHRSRPLLADLDAWLNHQ
jgi:transposase